MDSITQIALGAAVGEAALGRKVGGKAAAWGAALGTLPDLDVLANPFLSPAQELVFHRGPTHALLFSFVVGPLVGLLLARLHRRDGVGWKGWSWLAFLALFTHPLLDSLTAYGTQLFLPFSRAPVALNTISIIDPLYTVPLAAGTIAALFMHRSLSARRAVNMAGILVSSLYLVATCFNQAAVERVFKKELARERVGYEQLEVMPTLFNNILWIGLAADQDSVWVGLYSRLDDDEDIRFQRLAKRRDLLPPSASRDIETLLWFSRGLFTVTEEDGSLYFNDLHVGRTDFFASTSGDFIFRYRLDTDPSGRLAGLTQVQPSFDDGEEVFPTFLERILGAEPSPEEAVYVAPQSAEGNRTDGVDVKGDARTN